MAQTTTPTKTLAERKAEALAAIDYFAETYSPEEILSARREAKRVADYNAQVEARNAKVKRIQAGPLEAWLPRATEAEVVQYHIDRQEQLDKLKFAEAGLPFPTEERRQEYYNKQREDVTAAQNAEYEKKKTEYQLAHNRWTLGAYTEGTPEYVANKAIVDQGEPKRAQTWNQRVYDTLAARQYNKSRAEYERLDALPKSADTKAQMAKLKSDMETYIDIAPDAGEKSRLALLAESLRISDEQKAIRVPKPTAQTNNPAQVEAYRTYADTIRLGKTAAKQIADMSDEAIKQGGKSGQAGAVPTYTQRDVINRIVYGAAGTAANYGYNDLTGQDYYSEYDWLTDDEKSDFYYYLGKGDMGGAFKYLDNLKNLLESRRTTQTKKEVSAAAKEHPVGGAFLQFMTNFAKPGELLATGVSALGNAVKGDAFYEPSRPDSPVYAASQASQALQQGVEARITANMDDTTPGFLGLTDAGWARLGYGLVQSMAQSGANMALFGPASVYMMGAQAAGATAYTAAERGLSPAQAFTLGLGSGVIEALTEKVSVDRFFNLLRGSKAVAKSTALRLLTAIGGQAVAEGTEEVIAEELNTILDILVAGDASEYRQYKAELIKNDPTMSERDAEKAAFMQYFVKNAATAGIGGFVSGLGFGSIAVGKNAAVNAYNKRNAQKQESAEGNSGQGLVVSGQETRDAGTSAGTSAQDVAAGDVVPALAVLQQSAANVAEVANSQDKTVVDQNRAVTALLGEINSIDATSANVAAVRDTVSALTGEGSGLSRANNVRLNNALTALTNRTTLDTTTQAAPQTGVGQTARNIIAMLDTAAQRGITDEEVAGVMDTLNTDVLSEEEQSAIVSALTRAMSGGQTGTVNNNDVGGIQNDEQGEGARGEVFDRVGGRVSDVADGVAVEGVQREQGQDVTTEAGRGRNNQEYRQEDTRSGQIISARELGIEDGTDDAAVTLIAPADYTDEEAKAAEFVKATTGADLRVVKGAIMVRDADGNVLSVRGVFTENGEIIVQADDLGATAAQIARHETWHALDRATRGELTREAARRVRARYSEKELSRIARRYMQAYRGAYVGMSAAEVELNIYEEIMADAYAGINAFGMNAAKYGEIARETAAELTTQGQTKGEQRFSIDETEDGARFVNVDTGQRLFDGVSEREYPRIARKYILDNFRNAPLQVGEDGTARVSRRSAGEYSHNAGAEKSRAATELDNLLKVSEYSHSAPDEGNRQFASDGWDYRNVKFRINGNMFNGLINIAKSPDGALFYDMTNIESLAGNGQTQNVPSVSLTAKDSDSSNIPASNAVVNTSGESQSNNAKEVEESAKRGEQRFSVNPNFYAQFDAWDGKDAHGYFTLGMPSDVLLGIGVPNQQIVMDKSKIIAVMNKHRLDADTIRQLPEMLEQPVMAMKSLTDADSYVFYGELYDGKGNPVMAALRTKLRGGADLEILNKVTSAYARKNAQSLINRSEILYTDKERIADWLSRVGLQLPLIESQSNSDDNTIPNSDTSVNTPGESQSNTAKTIEDSAKRGEQRFSVSETDDGTHYVDVNTDQHIFDGLTIPQMRNVARRVILDRFRGRVIGDVNRAYVTRGSAEEYAYPAGRRQTAEVTDAKMRASTELDNLMSASEFVRHEDDDGRHAEATRGWDKYGVNFRVAGRMFNGEISVMLTERGDVFYDLTKIKSGLKTGGAPVVPVGDSRPVDRPTSNRSAYDGSVRENGVQSNTFSEKNQSQYESTKNQSNVQKFSLSDDTEYAPTFYSQLARVVEGHKGDKISAQGLESYLKSRGVKPDEIKWSGVLQFVEGKKSVGKDELLRFVRDNDTQLDTVHLFDDEGDTSYVEYTLPGGENYREVLLKLPNVKGSFRSAHWNHKNVVGHLRLQDFNDAEGNDVLLVEEVQSDWHEQGREKGYVTGDGITTEKDVNGYYRAYVDGERITSTDNTVAWLNEDAARLAAQRYIERNGRHNVVPDAPWRETWHELLMKRALRMAAEGGYGKLAWTTGAMQNERYDLSKVLSTVYAARYDDGSYFIQAYGPNNERINLPVRANVQYTDNDINDTFGKELGAKIIKNASDHSKTQEVAEIDMGDVEFRGEGMRNFYDVGGKSSQNIPRFMNKYVKQWGASVGETTLDNEARDRVWSVDVTPEMKRSVLYEGQQRFSLSSADIADNKRMVAEMEPVATLTGDEFRDETGTVRQKIGRFFESVGSVENPDIGEIALTESGIRDSLAHGFGASKVAAFAAVPDVLREGKIVQSNDNYEGRGYDTFAVAAPITIKNEPHFMAAVVMKSPETRRYYVHEVLSENDTEALFSTGRRNSVDSRNASVSTLNSLLRELWDVKRNSGAAQRFSLSDDPEAPERARRILDMSPVSVTPGPALTQKEAESAARSFGEMRNEDDGRSARLPVESARKIISHGGYETARIFNDIPELYETAQFAWSEPEETREGHKAHTNIKAYHHYVNKFSDGDGEYFIRFTVTEANARPPKTGENLIHSTAISDIEVYRADNLKDGPRSAPALTASDKVGQPSFVDTRLQQFFGLVNRGKQKNSLSDDSNYTKLLNDYPDDRAAALSGRARGLFDDAWDGIANDRALSLADAQSLVTRALDASERYDDGDADAGEWLRSISDRIGEVSERQEKKILAAAAAARIAALRPATGASEAADDTAQDEEADRRDRARRKEEQRLAAERARIDEAAELQAAHDAALAEFTAVSEAAERETERLRGDYAKLPPKLRIAAMPQAARELADGTADALGIRGEAVREKLREAYETIRVYIRAHESPDFGKLTAMARAAADIALRGHMSTVNTYELSTVEIAEANAAAEIAARELTADILAGFLTLSPQFKTRPADAGPRTAEEIARLNEAYARLLKTFGKYDPGETPARKAPVPLNTNAEDKDGFVRRGARNVSEAAVTEPETLEEIKGLIVEGLFTDTRQRQSALVDDARQRVTPETLDAELGRLSALFDERSEKMEPLSSQEMADFSELYTLLNTAGRYTDASDVAVKLAMFGTWAGRSVAAWQILKRLGPMGEYSKLNAILRKVSGDTAKKKRSAAAAKPGDSDMPDSIREQIFGNAEKDIPPLDMNDDEAVAAVEAEFVDWLAKRDPPSLSEKFRKWRYVAMLFNPVTWERNFIGNALMGAINAAAKPMERVMQLGLPESERTASTKRASKEVRSFAAQSYAELEDILRGDDPTDLTGRARVKRLQFKNAVARVMDEMTDAAMNGVPATEKSKVKKALSLLSDSKFLKLYYTGALADYIAARDLDITKPDTAELFAAKQYAIEEAQRLTYRQANKFSKLWSKLTSSFLGGGGGSAVSDELRIMLLGGALPYSKVPSNILATAFNMTPAGLLYDMGRVAKLNADMKRGGTDKAGNPVPPNARAQAISRLAQSVTGNSLMILLGIAGSLAGVIRIRQPDDEKGDADYLSGRRSYSLEVFGLSIPLAWAAPVSVPLFLGAAATEAATGKLSRLGGDNSPWGVAYTVFAGLLDPLAEMSMVKGVNDMLKSIRYSANGNTLVLGLALSMFESYYTQAWPSALSRLSGVFDASQRSTTPNPENEFPDHFERLWLSLVNKTPAARNELLEPRIDLWGREIKEDDAALRVANNFLLPAFVNRIAQPEFDRELERLYEVFSYPESLPAGIDAETAALLRGAVYPSSVPQTFMLGGEQGHRLSDEEYTKLATATGKLRYELVNDFINSETYSALTDAERAEGLDLIYRYANSIARYDMFGDEASTTKSDIEARDIAEAAGISVGEWLTARKRLNASAPDGASDADKRQLREEKGDFLISLGLDVKETYTLANVTDGFGVSDSNIDTLTSGDVPPADFFKLYAQYGNNYKPAPDAALISKTLKLNSQTAKQYWNRAVAADEGLASRVTGKILAVNAITKLGLSDNQKLALASSLGIGVAAKDIQEVTAAGIPTNDALRYAIMQDAYASISKTKGNNSSLTAMMFAVDALDNPNYTAAQKEAIYDAFPMYQIIPVNADIEDIEALKNAGISDWLPLRSKWVELGENGDVDSTKNYKYALWLYRESGHSLEKQELIAGAVNSSAYGTSTSYANAVYKGAVLDVYDMWTLWTDWTEYRRAFAEANDKTSISSRDDINAALNGYVKQKGALTDTQRQILFAFSTTTKVSRANVVSWGNSALKKLAA
ncbi:MAG: hypothetical protein LBS51_09255 [Oscillospiraceae bacterium]|jgi:hypothetical protein|nr:hypothetical protein [Oscillospiraceae bacterium]